MFCLINISLLTESDILKFWSLGSEPTEPEILTICPLGDGAT
jgi:hypothetical protein